jgi:UDP-N-acetylglucosamine 4-epimerase
VEDKLGKLLSQTAFTKVVNKLYTDVFSKTYGIDFVGLRYFNVFGRRQDPDSAYGAEIPKWMSVLIHGEPVFINGGGVTSRDFCYIVNALQANLLAATAIPPEAGNHVYNAARGHRTTLIEFFWETRAHLLQRCCPHLVHAQSTYRDFRPGDVRHSLADISRAQQYWATHPRTICGRV